MEVAKLRESRTRATVYFMGFSRLQNKYSDSIFCCFEGDDSKYYFKRIEDNTGYSAENIVPFNCDGKSEVLRMYRLIKSKSEYSDVKFLYFIDRDFDPTIKGILHGIYETPVYSIENFYTTIDAFIRILKIEFNYIEMDSEFKILLDLFVERQKEFHDQTKLFNAWIACQRRKSNIESTSRLNLSSFNLAKIVSVINLDTIQSNYDKQVLENLFPEAPEITDEEIAEKISEFDQLNFQQIFRGKYEIYFLYSFLEAIKIEINTPKSRLNKK